LEELARFAPAVRWADQKPVGAKGASGTWREAAFELAPPYATPGSCKDAKEGRIKLAREGTHQRTGSAGDAWRAGGARQWWRPKFGSAG